MGREAGGADGEHDALLAILRATLEATTDGILVLDRAWKMVTCNRRVFQAWGLKSTDAASLTEEQAFDLILTRLDDPQAFVDKAKELSSQPEATGFDVLQFKDGRVVEWHSQPLRLGSEIGGRVWSFRDVTEHRRAGEERDRLFIQERAARQAAEEGGARARFLAEGSRLLASLDCDAALAAVAQLAVPFLADWCVVDLLEESGAIRRVAVVHGDPAKEPMVRAIEGYPGVLFPQEGTLFEGVLAVDRQQPAVSAPEAQKALSELGMKSYLAVPLAAAGTTLGALVFVSAREEQRYGAADVALAEDLGGRAAMAVANARLYHRTEEALRARDEFLAIASHELRTPIASVQLAVQGLLEGVYTAAPPCESDPITKPLRSLERQTRRLGKLVGDMLGVAQIKAGQLEIVLAEVDLVEVARAAVVELASAASRARCQVSIVAAGPVIGRWDRSHLEEVATNLIANAILYGRGNPIEVEVKSEVTNAQFIVRDQGIGVAADRVGEIFKRFERAVSSRRYGGLGLGLYIVHQIVERLGGSVRVESALNVGSTFTVELPLAGPKDRP